MNKHALLFFTLLFLIATLFSVTVSSSTADIEYIKQSIAAITPKLPNIQPPTSPFIKTAPSTSGTSSSSIQKEAYIKQETSAFTTTTPASTTTEPSTSRIQQEEYQKKETRQSQFCYIPVAPGLIHAVALNPTVFCEGGQVSPKIFLPPAFVDENHHRIPNLKPTPLLDQNNALLTCSIPCEIPVKKTCLRDLGMTKPNYDKNPVDRSRCGETSMLPSALPLEQKSTMSAPASLPSQQQALPIQGISQQQTSAPSSHHQQTNTQKNNLNTQPKPPSTKIVENNQQQNVPMLPLPIVLTPLQTTPESLRTPSLGLNQPLSHAATDNTNIICGFTTADRSSQEITAHPAPHTLAIPQNFEAIGTPFSLTCNDDDLDVTLSVPGTYDPVTLIQCDTTRCHPLDTTISSDITCGGQTLETIRAAQAVQKSSTISLDTLNISFEEHTKIDKNIHNITLGTNRLSFKETIPPDTSVVLFSPKQALPNFPNPALTLAGTPTSIRISSPPGKIPATLLLGYPNTTLLDHDSLGIYLLENNAWRFIGGDVHTKEQTVTTSFDDITTILDNKHEATFTIVGITCQDCSTSHMDKIFDTSKSRTAVLFVHGLMSSPATWQEALDDFILNKQPYQLWTFAYSSSQPTNTIAQELSHQLELHAQSFDTISIVAHSLGGIVVQKALTMIQDPATQSKIKKIIILGTPNDGTPTIKIFQQFYHYLSNLATIPGIFNINSNIIQELQQGIHIPTQPQVTYEVLAGSKSYTFNTGFFSEPNDGITSIHGAQHLGDEFINNPCKNFYLLDMTHTELVYQSLARKIIERSITKNIPGHAGVGYLRYIRAKIPHCRPDQTFSIIGKKIPPERAETPLNCACGNGACGIDEDATTCPQDCSTPTHSLETLCLTTPILIPLLASTFLFFTFIFVILKYLIRHTITPALSISLYTTGALTFMAIFAQHFACAKPFTELFLVLLAVTLFLMLDFIRQKL